MASQANAETAQHSRSSPQLNAATRLALALAHARMTKRPRHATKYCLAPISDAEPGFVVFCHRTPDHDGAHTERI